MLKPRLSSIKEVRHSIRTPLGPAMTLTSVVCAKLVAARLEPCARIVIWALVIGSIDHSKTKVKAAMPIRVLELTRFILNLAARSNYQPIGQGRQLKFPLPMGEG